MPKRKIKGTTDGKKRSLKKLLFDLKSPIEFLSRKFNVIGYSSDDLTQIMRLNIVKTYKKNPKYCNRRKLGWWFLRCRWALLNLEKDNVKRNPLVKSISIDSIMRGSDWD